jgi:CBS domain-containing protein
MKVRDVMTTEVIAVAPDASLKEVAQQLSRHGISGVPVTDEKRRVVGVVSETEIVRAEVGDGREPGLLGRMLLGLRLPKLDGRTAGEAMTSPPINVSPEVDLADAARLMTERRVNRLPVVAGDGTLMGIVTRADLVRAFVRSDEEIERELREDVVLDTLWIDPADLWISVQGGEVRLAGKVDTKADAQLLEHFASRVPGVVSVHSTLRWRIDKPRLPRSDPRIPVPPRNRGR